MGVDVDLPIYINCLVNYLDFIAWCPDNPLDKILAWIFRILKNDYIASVGDRGFSKYVYQ